MAEKPPREWMAFYVLHYLGDTADLTFEQHGAYSLSLWVAWTRDGALPGDDDGCRRALSAYVKDCGSKRFNALVKPILERFFYRDENGYWRNKRLEKEKLKAFNISAAGRQAANSRWGNISNINNPTDTFALLAQSAGNAKQTNSNNRPFSSSARAKIPSYAKEPPMVSDELREGHSRGTK